MEKSIQTSSGKLTDSRRKFIEKAGLAAVMGTFGVSFFTSCSSTEDADPGNGNGGNSGQSGGITVAGSTIRIDLAVQTRLASSGGWLLIQDARTLVANINGSYVALTSVCTHSGCSDSWTFSNSRFTCTCHGSVFDSTGRVLQGPAGAPLQQFTTSLNGTTLTVTK
ncbi:ubiquinol-cytochrome c reductase iron-sulfur subunit [Algoriphagus sp. AK58]|uniref:QcrA and Rieske domain-containing protein n=1 Tax=Algoriphagus sp. AK58 TaxID=1406877 RepID=UPI0016500BD7|nr:Rieske (2Fe-2S) protein [Algoriphagus sp. AK58]MBC6367971.1 Rieske (2Fe-2S) protein [Algoriphagus sp. AK58]